MIDFTQYSIFCNLLERSFDCLSRHPFSFRTEGKSAEKPYIGESKAPSSVVVGRLPSWRTEDGQDVKRWTIPPCTK